MITLSGLWYDAHFNFLNHYKDCNPKALLESTVYNLRVLTILQGNRKIKCLTSLINHQNSNCEHSECLSSVTDLLMFTNKKWGKHFKYRYYDHVVIISRPIYSSSSAEFDITGVVKNSSVDVTTYYGLAVRNGKDIKFVCDKHDFVLCTEEIKKRKVNKALFIIYETHSNMTHLY